MNIDTQQPGTALEQALKKHLQQSHLPDFNNYLLDKILDRLNYERQMEILKPKLVAALGVILAGLTILVFAFILSLRGFSQTPTFNYVRLMFTDFKLILTNWQDYSLGILESLPLGALALLLSGLLGSIFLVDFAVKRYGNFRRTLNSMHYRTH